MLHLVVPGGDQGRDWVGGEGGVQSVHHEVGHPGHVRVLLSLQRLPVDTAGENIYLNDAIK